MDKKTIRISPFTFEKEKCCMCSVKFMAGCVIKGYHVLIKCANEIPIDDIEEKE